MRLALCIFLLLSSANIIGQSTLFDSIKTLVFDESYEEAIAILDTCSSEKCNYTRADLNYRLGNYTHPKENLGHFTEHPEYRFSANKILARIYESELNYPKAIKHNIVLSYIDSSNFIHHRKLGKLYSNAGYTLEALKAFNTALDMNSSDLSTLTSLAELNFSLSQTELADSIIHLAHTIDSSNIKVQLIRAKIFYKQKEYKEVAGTLGYIKGRIDLDDYFSKIYGYSLVKIDSFEKAKYTLHKVLLNDPDAESVHYYLGLAYENTDEPETADFHFSRAIESGISKQIPLYYKKIARIAEKDKKWQKAIKHYRKSLEYKNDPEVLFMLALATDNYYKDKSIAVKYYNKYLEAGHPNKEWNTYSLQRKKYLKEIAFLKSN